MFLCSGIQSSGVFSWRLLSQINIIRYYFYLALQRNNSKDKMHISRNLRKPTFQIIQIYLLKKIYTQFLGYVLHLHSLEHFLYFKGPPSL